MYKPNLLIIEDDTETSDLIARILRKDGFNITIANSAEESLKIIETEHFDLILSDWVLPGMSGPELCKTLSEREDKDFYFLLLTGKTNKSDIAFGMNSGADDFLTKPVHNDELRARIKAGVRQIELQKRLKEKNQQLTERNKELANAYIQMRNDLQTAVYFQQSILPEPKTLLNSIKFETLYIPCDLTSGDTFNYFALDERTIGFYLLDVCGHGVSAAMISYAINKALTPDSIPSSILKEYNPANNNYYVLSPEKALERLNQFYQTQNEVIEFFTIVYGTIDIQSNILKISHAGHPDAFYIQQGNNDVIRIKSRGPAIGLLPSCQYECTEIKVTSKDRCFIYSDGLLEATNNAGEQFGLDRFEKLILDTNALSIETSVKKIEDFMKNWNEKGNQFLDDVTLLAMEFLK